MGKALPAAQACLRLLGVERARDLAMVMVAVGLAQNLAALWALATGGIQRGHMALHARQLALAAGAVGREVELVAARLVRDGVIRDVSAEQALREIRAGDREKHT